MNNFWKLVAFFWSDKRAGPAAEFTLVLPVALLFIFGIVDVGRLMWTWNQAEKATQMGVRYAVATNMVPTDLASYSFALTGGLTQGDPVPEASFPGVECSGGSGSATCACVSGGSCSFGMTADATAFANIVGRIALFKPDVTAANVLVDYGYSGLGFAGDPNGPDVAPLVTVRLRNLNFTPLVFQLFGASVTLPDFSAALTMEDGDGTVAN